MIFDENFKRHISYLDIDYLRDSKDVICIVDNELRLRAYNDAWINFARNNNGASILERFSLGAKISEVGAEPIRSFMIQAYRKAIEEHKPFEHQYECSSPDQYRVFYQTAYPLINSKGLVITHHLVIEQPHTADAVQFSRRFENVHQMITQCANCRKIMDPEDDKIWFWVPALVQSPLANISHSICPPCMEHYYPDVD